jgi:methyl-accepting chemotaxis protein
MKHMTIGKKLITSFTAVTVITLLLGLVGYYGASESKLAIGQLGTELLPSVEQLLLIDGAQATVDAAEKTLLSREIDLKARQEEYAIIAAAWKDAEAATKAYDALHKTAGEEAEWKRFGTAWTAWKKDHEAYVALSREYDKTVEAQQKSAGLNSSLASQATKVNPVSFGKAEDLLNRIVRICRARLDDAQATFSKADSLAIHSLLTIKEAQTAIESSENSLLDRTAALDERQGNYDRIESAWQRVEAARKTYEALKQTPEEAGLWKEFVPAWGKWKADDEAFVALSKSYDTTVEDYLRSNELLKQMGHQALVVNKVSFTSAEEFLAKLVSYNMTEAGDTTKASSSQAGVLKTVSITTMIVGVVASLAMGSLITRGINKSLRQVCDSLSAGADQTTAAASQVASASQTLAGGASEQAASLEETSASLEEMTSMVKRNADSAQQAKEISTQTRAAADTGARDMEQMQQSMGAIKTSSDEIAKIVKNIDEIAFQTNILALNAAVEAARAGEAGAGFAVVADEVRNLAQRSATAAKETANKIEDAIAKTTHGVEVSGKVAESLKQIIEKARTVDDLVGEIASASKEQAQGIQQVNTAVTQMDKVTQSNAASAEESASASEELSSQAQAVKDSVETLQALVGGSTRSRGSVRHEEVSHHPAPAKKRSDSKASARTSPAHAQGNGQSHGNGRQELATVATNGRNSADLPMPEKSGFKNF